MKRPCRIGLISEFPLNFQNAQGSRFLYLARELSEAGFEVTVAGTDGGETVSLRTITVPPCQNGGTLHRFLAPHRVALRLLRRCRGLDVDVFWVRGLILAPLFALLGRLTGKRVILDFHGFLYREMQADQGNLPRRLTALYARLWERLTLRWVHGVVSAGAGHAHLLAQYGAPDNHWTLPNGLDADDIAPTQNQDRRHALRAQIQLDDETPLFLFIGAHRAYWDRSVFTCIAAAVAPGKVLVIGDGWPPQSAPEDGVIYLGSLPHSEVMDWARSGADVGLCPYRADWVNAPTPHYMNATRKLLEYLAVGLPTLLPHMAALPDYLTEGEHFLSYPPQSSEALASAARRLVERPDERRRMGAACATLAPHFTWQQQLTQSGVLAWLQSPTASR